MPIRKNTSSSVTSPTSVASVQQKVLDNSLEKITNVKDTPLSRLGGIKSKVTYFRKKTEGGNDYITNTSAFNSIDPNLDTYEEIRDFIVIFESLSGEIDGESILSIEQEGECLILPGTIRPGIGDFFLAKIVDYYNLYRITEMDTSPIEKDSGYKVNFKLDKDHVDPNNIEVLKDLIVDTFIFEYNHVGTSFRSVFKEDEYAVLNKMKDFYIGLSEIYNDFFYDKKTGTYFLPTDFMPESAVDNLNVFNYLTITDEYDVRDPLISGVSDGYNMYDPCLIEFINNNNLFAIDSKHMYISTYANVDNHEYRNSVFRAIEDRSYKLIKRKYQRGKYITFSTPSILPILYGSLLLEHVSTKEDDCFDFYPKAFITEIKSTTTPVDYTTHEYSNSIEEMVDIIVSYINKHNVDIYTWISKFFDKLDLNYEPKDLTENPYEVFYIYPLFAYILKYLIDELSGRQFK